MKKEENLAAWHTESVAVTSVVRCSVQRAGPTWWQQLHFVAGEEVLDRADM